MRFDSIVDTQSFALAILQAYLFEHRAKLCVSTILSKPTDRDTWVLRLETTVFVLRVENTIPASLRFLVAPFCESEMPLKHAAVMI